MRDGAAAVVFDEHGRVLVVKENYGKHRYSLPGGMIERDEAPQDAAVRETLEETGATVAVDHLVGLYRFDDGFQVFVFRCLLTAGKPGLQPTDELSEVGWYLPEALPDPRSNALHHALPDALAGRRGVVADGLPRLT